MVSREAIAGMGYMYLYTQGLISWNDKNSTRGEKPDCRGRVYVNGRRCQ